jgi:hypothetical protein
MVITSRTGSKISAGHTEDSNINKVVLAAEWIENHKQVDGVTM